MYSPAAASPLLTVQGFSLQASSAGYFFPSSLLHMKLLCIIPFLLPVVNGQAKVFLNLSAWSSSSPALSSMAADMDAPP